MLRRVSNDAARWDVRAQTYLRSALGLKSRARVAHLVRQDIWRAMKSLRGFSPIVEVTRDDAGFIVNAGGTVAGAVSPVVQSRLQSVLDDTSNRNRWMRCIGFALALPLMVSVSGVAANASPVGADASDMALPSGQTLTLHEVLAEEDIARFRFVAPEISRETGYLTYADVELDFQHICEEFALPWMSEHAQSSEVIVISMSERAVPLGTKSPEVTQFFEAFRPESDRCIWEQF